MLPKVPKVRPLLSEEVWLRSRQLSPEGEEEATTSVSRGSGTLGSQPVSHQRLGRPGQGPEQRGSCGSGSGSAAPAPAAAGRSRVRPRLQRGGAERRCCGRKGVCRGLYKANEVSTDWARLRNPTPFPFSSVSPLAVSLPPLCFPHPKITSSAATSARIGGTVLSSWFRFVHTENHPSPSHNLFYFSRAIFNANDTTEGEMTRHDGVAVAKTVKCSSSSHPCLSLFPFSLLGEVPIAFFVFVLGQLL